MSVIVEQEGYQYVALGIATIAFVPQLILSWKTKSMAEVSWLMLSCITASGGLWGVYMYEKDLVHFAIATFGVTIMTTLLIFMKFTFYMQGIRNSFNAPPDPQPFILQPANQV